MNAKILANLLTISNPEKETIFDVIGRMKVLLEFFKRNSKHKNLVPFLKTYYLITKSVAERSVEHSYYFRNLRLMHELDIYFANLYFAPLKNFLIEGRLHKPWQTYFAYCRRQDGIPFVQMLLGINAHINSDLLTTIVNLHYHERADFLTINQILKEEIPDVMRFLAYVDHDVYGFGALIFKRFILREFRNTIVAWRQQVWKNAQIVDKQNYPKIRGRVHSITEEIGRKVVEIFHEQGFRSFAPAISRLNNLKLVI